jgi:hypothetical protein
VAHTLHRTDSRHWRHEDWIAEVAIWFAART